MSGLTPSGDTSAAWNPEEQAVKCLTCDREMTTAEAISGDCCEACLDEVPPESMAIRATGYMEDSSVKP